MNNSRRSGAETVPLAAGASKRVILSMGGKGGVGKTSVMAGLAEWFDTNQIPVKLLDLDTENKARGSLTHFFGGRVPKVNIRTPAGLGRLRRSSRQRFTCDPGRHGSRFGPDHLRLV